MRLLLDECVPRPIRRLFEGHEVMTVEQAGLKGLENGDLLRAAGNMFEVLVTTDKNIEYQQNPNSLPMAILILSAKSNRLIDLEPLLSDALRVLEDIRVGEIATVKK